MFGNDEWTKKMNEYDYEDTRCVTLRHSGYIYVNFLTKQQRQTALISAVKQHGKYMAMNKLIYLTRVRRDVKLPFYLEDLEWMINHDFDAHE